AVTTVNDNTGVINRVNATITVTPYSVTYDANSHTATGSVTGVGSDGALSGLNLSGTTHTDAADYPTDSWTFTDVTGNYNNANSTVHDSIAKRALTVTVANVTKLFGAPIPTLTGTITGVQGGDNITASYGTMATQNSPVGNYPITATLNDP